MPDKPSDMQAPRGEVPAFTQRVLVVVSIVWASIAFGAMILYAFDVLLLLFAGVLFGVFLNGVSRWAEGKTAMPYKWSLATVTVLLVGLFCAGFVILIPQIADQVTQLSDELTESMARLEVHMKQYPLARQILERAPRLQDLFAPDSNFATLVSSAFTTAFGFVGNTIIVFFVGLYLAADPALYRDGVAKLFPLKKREHARSILNDMGQAMFGWLKGQLIAMTIIGVFTAIGLSLLGIPLAMTLAVLTALLTFIPNFGPIISVIPPALLALQQGPAMMLSVLLLYLTLQTVESYLITPLIQQREASLPPVLTIFAQIFMGILVGILGIAMATPMAAAALVAVKKLYVGDVLKDERTAQEAVPD